MMQPDAVTARVRPIAESDLDAVLRIQAACYPPAMQEGRETVRARIRAAAATSFVVADADAIRAYVFSYRSRRGAVTPLNAPFAPAADGDALYIHDLAVAPAAAGRGLARRLALHLLALARDAGLAHCALVSVQDSRAFWERLGFTASDCAADALAGYPCGALYMCAPMREAGQAR